MSYFIQIMMIEITLPSVQFDMNLYISDTIMQPNLKNKKTVNMPDVKDFKV